MDAMAIERLRRLVDEWRGQMRRHQVAQCHYPVRLIQGEVADRGIEELVLVGQQQPLNKVLAVLGFNCVEIAKLRKEAHSRIFPRLLVFGHWKEVPPEAVVQENFARMYGFFYELTVYISSLRAAISNLVQQLQAFCVEPKRKQLPSSLCGVRFFTAVTSLGEGLAILITLDEIVAHNAAVGHAISVFLRLIRSARAEPSKFEASEGQMLSLDQAVNQMEELLVGGIFQRSLQADFCLHVELEKGKANTCFLEEISLCLRDALWKVIPCIDSPKEQPRERETLVGLFGVFVLYAWMAGESLDKKTFKLILKLVTKLPVLHPAPGVRLMLLDFLKAHLPHSARSWPSFKELSKEAATMTQSYLASLDEMLIRGALSTDRAVVNWCAALHSLTSPLVSQLSNASLLGMLLKICLQGLPLANNVRCVVRSAIDLHSLLEVPVSKEQVRRLRSAMVLLKCMRTIYQKRNLEIAQGVVHILELLKSHVRNRLLQLESDLQKDLSSKAKNSNLGLFRSSSTAAKEADNKVTDALSSVKLALKVLETSPGLQGRTLFRLAFDAVCGMQGRLSEESIIEIRDYISMIDHVSDYEDLMDMVTDCSFLYWNRELLNACCSSTRSQGDEARDIEYTVLAFLDVVELLKAGFARQPAIESYEKEIEDSLVKELVEPLCRDIETDLRLHVHSAHLKGAVTVNPTKTGVRDLSWLLSLRPLKLASKHMHIKSRVENYLNAAFYDHAAVAPHNWETYNGMKLLAEQKYGLSLHAIHLPGQSLEQGVDVLEIMRNIHIFVSCYTYSLSTQAFVERISNARDRKHLNTVNVKHVANSIRTHGTGIMSTTVNFAYQFLSQKFVGFSQFLFDDHIKSRLMKEQRFYKDMKKKGADSGYPALRAEKLSKDIRKLGSTEDGSSFMDQFRRLIAEMGNVLGFVRMVRLGGLHHCAIASGFQADVGNKLNFKQAAETLGLDSHAVEGGEILDRALESQTMSMGQTDYFTILTNVFTQELQSSENIHLRDFFLIVPALTLNAAEAMLQAKEKLHKRGRDASQALFTDDGFPLGLAYILKVLGQDKQYDSLGWFPSVKSHIVKERARLEESLDMMDSTGSGMNGLQAWSQKLASLSKEEAQNMQLMMKRLTSLLAEIELIEFTLTGSRVFFQ